MTGNVGIRVVICAGGLGTRTAAWSRYIPKEFYPVGGRPGITHLLDEISQSGPAEAVIVCHSYYGSFTAWARSALSQDGQDRYARAARLRPGPSQAGQVKVSFITQHGPYADLTSVLNGADHFAADDDLYVAFSDNLYLGANPLRALRREPAGQTVILGRPYQRELAASHGVIVTIRRQGQRLMRELIEKPGLVAAAGLERRYGTGHLRLLQGRARLTEGFVSFARGYRAPSSSEPRLALTLAAYASRCPVRVITTNSHVIDLGAPPACGCGDSTPRPNRSARNSDRRTTGLATAADGELRGITARQTRARPGQRS